jgi:hypothetical protein
VTIGGADLATVPDSQVWSLTAQSGVTEGATRYTVNHVGLLAILGSIMLKRETIPIADIYVPIKRRATLNKSE